jgi:hypothetical protein
MAMRHKAAADIHIIFTVLLLAFEHHARVFGSVPPDEARIREHCRNLVWRASSNTELHQLCQWRRTLPL